MSEKSPQQKMGKKGTSWLVDFRTFSVRTFRVRTFLVRTFHVRTFLVRTLLVSAKKSGEEFSTYLTAGVANTLEALFVASASVSDKPTTMASVSWTSTSGDVDNDEPPSDPVPGSSMSISASPVCAT